MAYPPAALPTNRTNATPQTNNHPADHNAIGQAVNDTVAELGANPSGLHADLGVRLEYEGTRSAIVGGVDHFTNFGGFIIQSASQIVTTDSNGNVLVNYPHAFEIAPITVATNGDAAAAGHVYLSLYNNSTSQFTVQARDGAAGTPIPNATVRVNWIAVGPRAA